MKVAVYGTLRRGHGNHRLLENAKFEGRRVVSGFNMFMLGSVIPGIKPGDGEVTVETYSEYDLGPLDQLEGHPNFYKREVVDIDDEPHYIYVYQGNVQGQNLVESGDYNHR